MKNKYINVLVEDLHLNANIASKLKVNNITTLNDLWHQTRSSLKNFDLTNEDINTISIRLQLLGLDLNKKVY